MHNDTIDNEALNRKWCRSFSTDPFYHHQIGWIIPIKPMIDKPLMGISLENIPEQ